MSFVRFKKRKNQINNKESHESSSNNLIILSNFICHRIPERTFNIRGHYFPVCARCTGFYLGALAYFVYAYYFYIDYSPLLIIVAILMLVPTLLDGFTQLFGFRKSSNILRLFTGLIGGVGLAILIKAIKWYIIMG
jgi:uncharacterized membrane protein